jgi:hypothetical protein
MGEFLLIEHALFAMPLPPDASGRTEARPQ